MVAVVPSPGSLSMVSVPPQFYGVFHDGLNAQNGKHKVGHVKVEYNLKLVVKTHLFNVKISFDKRYLFVKMYHFA